MNFELSLVIPAYNAQDTLSETIESGLMQDLNSLQIIIVDDGSTDNTLEIAREYADKHHNIKVIHQNNKGTGGAYNTGVLNADAQWVSICSADDVLYPRALSTLWDAHLAQPEMSIVMSNGDFWCDDIKKKPVYDSEFRNSGEVELESVLSACFYGVGAIYDKKWFEVVEGYNERMYAEDYDFWLRIMMRGARAYYVNEILSANRVSSTQKSASLARLYQADILILQACDESGLLSPKLAEVCRASIFAYSQKYKELTKLSAVLKRNLIALLVKIFGRDELEQMIHKLKGK